MSDRNDIGMAAGIVGIVTFGFLAVYYAFKLAWFLWTSISEIIWLDRKIKEEEKRKASEAAGQPASSQNVLPFSRPQPSAHSPSSSAE